MCNHYRHDVEILAIWDEYDSWNLPDIHSEIVEDIWPKRQAPVVRVENDKRIIEAMHWGLPWTGRGKRPGTTRKMNTTNIRNLEGGLVRGIVNAPENRCLVPFTRFAEPKPNAGREEVWFTVSEAEVAAFAGIWRPDKDQGRVFAFLTCEPNPLLKPVHRKAMPVILQPEDYERWLSGEDAEGFQEPFPSQLMAIV